MQNTVETKKAGAGIITMSVLYLFGQGFMIIGSLFIIFSKDSIISYYESIGLGNVATGINIAEMFITLAISVIIAISVILLLFKKPIGAYMFIGIEILSSIYRAISSGIGIGSFIILIFPALMIFFIYKKKDIYFPKEELEN
ncbi:MAG: hypothetical protein MR510_00705 [Clostridium sp.]|uniref:hypothetical protein n=1 Tax=Clostridium sp. TaxID=1506 RepID=UPI0025DF979D|nr:hypothetical protein [Clostridium sp.]MCI6690999.1 hypothetical protein [Clostridium sp.]MDY2631189.1 hypothetical protein [Clostridium sp.]